MKKTTITILVAMVLTGLASIPLSAQNAEKPRLAVFGFMNQTGDEAFTVPAETASSNLLLTMRLLNLFQVTEAETVPRNLTDSSIDQWCTKNNIDFVIFGTMTKTQDDRQEYQIDWFSHAAKRITDRNTETGESVLDVFSVVDTLTEAMLGTISNNKISFGSLRFVNRGIQGDYDVYLDGAFIQTNPAQFDRVPSGEHSIRIVQKATGAELLARKLTIVKGKAETAEFTLKETEPQKVQAGGKARFESGKPGKIFIGKELIGNIAPASPIMADTLQTGNVEVRFEATDGMVETKTISVTDKAYVTVGFAPVAGAAATDDAAKLENLRNVERLIKGGLKKNKNEIMAASVNLDPFDKTNVYGVYHKGGFVPFAFNTLVLPVSIGSFIQGDLTGGIVSSALKVGGILEVAWFASQIDAVQSQSDINTAMTVFYIGVGTFIVGDIYGMICPWTFAGSYNRELKYALGLKRAVKAKPAVSFVPVGDSLGLRLGMSLDY
jgi:TolB-like protein